MQYLAWRVLNGRKASIEISFLPYFELIKQRFRSTELGCLQHIAHVIDDSSHVNVP
uniref:Uncharacterized protein n=1 Tax=Amphimedon queenslandica TaxID=400682 RepID=A0A1X7UDD5_AMPQE